MLQGQRDLLTVCQTDPVRAGAAGQRAARHLLYQRSRIERTSRILKLLASYAYKERKNLGQRSRSGEGLVGQCALEKETHPAHARPGRLHPHQLRLGEAPPLNIVVLPVLFEGR